MGYLPDTTFVSFGKPKAMWQPILATYEQRLSKAGSFRHVVLREKGDGAECRFECARRVDLLDTTTPETVRGSRGTPHQGFCLLCCHVPGRKRTENRAKSGNPGSTTTPFRRNETATLTGG